MYYILVIEHNVYFDYQRFTNVTAMVFYRLTN